VSNQVYSLALSYVSGGQFAQNIIHYQFDDSGFSDSAAAAVALANAFDAANTTHLKNMLPTADVITSYKGRCITRPGGFEGIKLAGSVFGTRTGNLSVTAPSPVIVLFPTGNAKPRGRVFLPGITDTDLVDGEFTTNFRTAVTTHAVMFVNTLTLTGGGSPVATPVIASRKTVPVTPYTVEYAFLSDMVGTIRRRQRPA